MKHYNIYIRSNEHPRTINSYRNERCYYTRIVVHGMEELKSKVAELRAKGERIIEVTTKLGTRIYI